MSTSRTAYPTVVTPCVFHAHHGWNSLNSTAVDSYRIGQDKAVMVYRLITCGSIEEKIYRKQIYKDGLFRTATESKNPHRYFTKVGRSRMVPHGTWQRNASTRRSAVMCAK